MNYYVVVDELQDPDGITEWTYLIETKTSCKLNVPNAKLTKKKYFKLYKFIDGKNMWEVESHSLFGKEYASITPMKKISKEEYDFCEDILNVKPRRNRNA